MLILANRGIHYPSRNERYMLGLFVYQENSFLDSGNKKKLFNKAIVNLNAFDQNEYNNGQNRAWFTQRASVRNMLAFCNYQLAMVEKDSIKKDEYFNACFQNAPDQSDITKGGGDVFYDNGFLIHIYTTKPEYLKKYYLYLSETGNGKALFDGWLKHTLIQPTKENYKNTKAVFDSLFPKQNFDSVWHYAVAKILLPKPADARMLVKDTSRTWTLIDFWGTWCKPCIEELPEVQKINKEKVQTGDLGLFTFSYNSTQLNAFMQKNKYDFPVEEVDEKVIVDYKVIGFPTKFLVYKTGQYIPLSLHNWKEEIEVFTGK
jgi:thiol-disulfide isomerase/thioredoxin